MLLSLPVFLNREEQNTMLTSPNWSSVTGIRDLIILSLFLNYGLRLSELINLEWSDLDFQHRVILIRESTGANQRELLLRKSDIQLLIEWDKVQYSRKLAPKLVITTLSGNKMSGSYIESILSRHAKRSGILKRISPHTLRHIFAVDSYKKTGNIYKVSQLLGHQYISTTKEYLKIVDSRVSPTKLRWMKI